MASLMLTIQRYVLFVFCSARDRRRISGAVKLTARLTRYCAR